MGKCYSFRQEVPEIAELYIFGDINEEDMYDSDVPATGFAAELERITAPEINVHIDSYGGDVSAGWTMFNLLRRHPAKIRTYGDGFVASAALYPFLAGDERIASNVSAYFLHQVMTYAQGYADDLRRAADEAERITDIGINAFVEITRMDYDTVLNMMKAETWLTPDEALSYGIATSIVNDGMSQYAQSVKRQIMQKLRQSVTEQTPTEPTAPVEPTPETEIIPIPETPPEPTTESKEELEEETGNKLMNLLAGFSVN